MKMSPGPGVRSTQTMKARLKACYADCVKWCEEQAALCWAAQQAQAAAAE